jgi:hypothetical protein
MISDKIKILENVNKEKLEKEINSFLEKDWKLQGNICFNPNHNTLIQVIILKEENRE